MKVINIAIEENDGNVKLQVNNLSRQYLRKS